jgi:hypothetical protein
MSLFWLAYRQGETTCVLIQPAGDLVMARLKASLQTPGLDEHFVSGLALERDHQVPADMIGRLLSQEEAHQVVKLLERAIPKKRAAASVRRGAGLRKRQT